jgi:hypothetical protein
LIIYLWLVSAASTSSAFIANVLIVTSLPRAVQRQAASDDQPYIHGPGDEAVERPEPPEAVRRAPIAKRLKWVIDLRLLPYDRPTLFVVYQAAFARLNVRRLLCHD